MKGTDKQKQMLKDLGIQDWTEVELKEARDGFTLEQYTIAELRRESESKPLPNTAPCHDRL